MNESRAERRNWITRRGYAGLALMYGLFIIYGSLVPLIFRSITLAQALREFSEALAARLYIDSNADFVTNILLTIPLAYLTLAAFMTDRRGVIRRTAATLLTLASCFTLSVGVEFAQVFTQGRTDSLSDIVAQAAGAVLGVLLWLAIGNRVTSWVRESLQEREQPAMIQRVLLVYCVVFAITQVLPLDLTISLGQLADKYRRGMILLRPFAYQHVSTFDMWWDYSSDVALNIPVGAAAVLLWTWDRSRRGPVFAFGLGVAAVVLVEFAQIFVNSRFADATDIITGSLGVLVGVALTTWLTSRERAPRTPHTVAVAAVLARVGVGVWVVVLMAYHWNPFDFTAEPVRVTAGMHQFFSVPFYSYYQGSEFHALTEMLRKSVLAAPLGALLRISWPRDPQSPPSALMTFVLLSFGFGVLVAIELGQVFLPTRTPDITDALIGEIGLMSAFWLAGRLSSLRDYQTASPSSRMI
jgi:glycopeptide antibiotics resistance protein